MQHRGQAHDPLNAPDGVQGEKRDEKFRHSLSPFSSLYPPESFNSVIGAFIFVIFRINGEDAAAAQSTSPDDPLSDANLDLYAQWGWTSRHLDD